MIAKKVTQDTNEYQFFTTETVQDVNGNSVDIPRLEGTYTKDWLTNRIADLDAQKAKFQSYLDAIPTE
jgi:hypothetical protein